jgi:predicted ATPase/DNA-binding winged helix-turn-helix (wHTH) protein
MSAPGNANGSELIYFFGRYRLLPKRWLLLAEDKPVELGSRAFQMLLALVEARGELVTRDTLLKRVWPCTIVGPQNIDFQIYALRKAFGSDRDIIRTDTGRGYRLAAEVREASVNEETLASTAPVAIRASKTSATNIPLPISSLVGRERELRDLQRLVLEHRLVTLTGPGGMGKTRLALEAARHVLQRFADGVWLIKLESLAESALVPNAMGRALGIELGGDQSGADQLVAALHRKQMLLVLDNCEHVVEMVAATVETLLGNAPALHVLATSQEPLAAEGEWVYPVSSLRVPQIDDGSAAEIGKYDSVQLFTDRARAADPTFSLNDRTAPAISAICRQLDGIPLAIELAAARVATVGLDMLAAGLNDRFWLLTGGRRKALRRHQRLTATLDWSYGLLTEDERAILRRLSVFAGTFTLDSAAEVAGAGEINAAQAGVYITTLTAKSLVTLDGRGSQPRYRLLDTTRAYLRQKLSASGEFVETARRHAGYFRRVLEHAAPCWETTPPSDLIAKYGSELDDIRAALNWAFDAEGDLETGLALAIAAIPLWLLMSVLGECRDFARKALSRIEASSRDRPGQEVGLLSALAMSSMWVEAPVAAAQEAAERALRFAETAGNAEYQLRALFVLWNCRLRLGEYPACAALARRFRQIADCQADVLAQRTAVRLDGVVSFFAGDFAKARSIMEAVISDMSLNARHSLAVRFGMDQRIAAITYLARVLWIQGFPDQAARLVEAGVEQARALKHANALCLILCDAACGIAALTGDTRLDDLTAMLLDCAEKHGLGMWQMRALAFKGLTAVRRDNTALGLVLLRSTFEGARGARAELRHSAFVEGVADALVAEKKVDEAIGFVQNVLDDSLRNEGLWCVPELLRLRGELSLRDDGAEASDAAERDFLKALELAEKQGARSWQLRAGTSSARLWMSQARPTDARNLLVPIYGWFTEGFGTADLRAAKDLIGRLD